jgi:hypothetical protein
MIFGENNLGSTIFANTVEFNILTWVEVCRPTSPEYTNFAPGDNAWTDMPESDDDIWTNIEPLDTGITRC